MIRNVVEDLSVGLAISPHASAEDRVSSSKCVRSEHICIWGKFRSMRALVNTQRGRTEYGTQSLSGSVRRDKGVA